MNRTFSCIAVLSMLLLAVAICIKQTIDFREFIAGSTVALLFAAEGILAGLLVASVISLSRKQFVRQKKPVSRRPVPVTA